MRLGVLTYHRAENYGGCLQAFALKNYLEQKGNNVEFIDYWPDYHKKHYKYFNPHEFRKRNWKGKIAYIVFTVFSLPWLIKRRKKFRFFINTQLRVIGNPVYRKRTHVCSTKYDAVLFGSDQIWRKQNYFGFEGYDSWYFGDHHVACPSKIAYAASVGNLNRTRNTDNFFRKQMENFTTISVREQEIKKWLEELGYKPELVVDPVLLLKKEDWLKLCEPSKLSSGKYILFYNLLETPESVNLAVNLAKERGCEIRELTKSRSLRRQGRKQIRTASIGEFLSLIANAEVVVGNSFHGVAFSILFEKEFYAVGLRNFSQRVESLLSVLGISERYIKDGTYNQNLINYRQVEKKLEQLRSFSQQFLENSLKNS